MGQNYVLSHNKEPVIELEHLLQLFICLYLGAHGLQSVSMKERWTIEPTLFIEIT